MASRLLPRLYVLGAAALPRRRQRPAVVRRLLIAHHLLLGDTIMLTPLIKKARERFPQAEIAMTCPRAYAPIYAGRPYGLTILPFDPRSLSDHRALRRQRGFDLALVPGDNRWSALARALDARWIVAFAPDERSYKDWPVDEMRAMPDTPMAWGDIAARLLDGDAPAPYSPRNGPLPNSVHMRNLRDRIACCTSGRAARTSSGRANAGWKCATGPRRAAMRSC